MHRAFATASLLCTLFATTWGASIDELSRSFSDPPNDSKIMVRWWWFGSAVTTDELDREMRQIKDAGIGGFEVQPVYPVVLDDPKGGIRNLPYLSPEFLSALQFTSQRARDLGLRFDLTLGSGWPFGGPHIPITQAAGRLRCDRVPVPAGATSISLPKMAEGEKYVAAFLARGNGKAFSASGITPLNASSANIIELPATTEPHVVLFFISSRTKMMVKRPAVGAEGYVLDHYDRTAVDNHLKHVGEPLLAAVKGNLPTAIFSDSLEVFGSDWTGDFLEQFRKRRGYALTPYLPGLVGDIGDKTGGIRNDWALTLTELVNERYLTPISEWAHQHGTKFRSQTYGTPPVTLSSSRLVDLPEGEGTHWRAFSSTRWATSASHLYGRNVTSSETWTWLHSPSFRATPLDFKVEADLHFLQGINQLVGHGWPYSPPQAGEPGWRFYAATVLNPHNPWWIVMPDLSRYLQRVSFMLRQGTPANDVAVYLPTADARATFTLGRDSVDRSMDAVLGPKLIPAILDSGYNFDFIDDEAIANVGIPHRAIVLPGVERMPLATAEKLAEYVRSGGIVIATRRTPSRAPGLLEAERDSGRIAEVFRNLKLNVVTDDATTGSALTAVLPQDMPTKPPEIGFVHRKLPDADIYFVANTSNHDVEATLRFRSAHKHTESWNPFDGTRNPSVGGLRLAPYESRIFVLQDGDGAAPNVDRPDHLVADLTRGWTVTFAGKQPVRFDQLHSWTDDEATRYYSGAATYERTIDVPQPQTNAYLTFGRGTPVAERKLQNGMRAWLESPVREAALVYVNDQLAGSVWHPPYEVEVGRFLKAGENRIRIVVGNTAINTLAGEPLPDYSALNAKYGVRFVPQDMENLQPLPSGLLGPIRLVAE